MLIFIFFPNEVYFAYAAQRTIAEKHDGRYLSFLCLRLTRSADFSFFCERGSEVYFSYTAATESTQKGGRAALIVPLFKADKKCRFLGFLGNRAAEAYLAYAAQRTITEKREGRRLSSAFHFTQ
ncbi:MAG: hypothetical protein IKK29_05375 [Christensenellaceae bacterium]|nr:hypothetical protein [Christensenellaceae bacterium]